MATNLSRFFRQRRLAFGLRPGAVAQRMGYKSIVGAANKIVRFEETGEILAAVLVKLAAVLEIDHSTIQRLMDEDRRQFLNDWNRWADEPIEPHVIFRAIPGVMVSKDIPSDLRTQEEMEAFAADIAQRFGKKVWLVLSRRKRIYFDESAIARSVQEARPGQCNGPFMRLGSSKKRFLFTADSNGLGTRPLNEPEYRGPSDKHAQ
jgi:hypothetical protein